jgi:hypothetical protein
MEQKWPRRLYTVEEARALVPQLRSLMATIQVEQIRLQEEIVQLNELSPAMQENGYAAQAAKHESMILGLSESIREKLDQFEELGIDVKDIENGIVDFPSERDGRIILLCWQVDEETVMYWHEVEDGFRGRQALNE